MSINSIEDVAAAVDKPFWFQLYVMRDRGFIKELIQRAAAAKCSALMLTVDLQVLGQRHADVRNGLTVPPEIKIRNVIDIMTKPAWAWSILKGKRKTFGNLAGYVKGMENVNSLAQWTASQFDPTLNWKDVEWVKSIWPGKLILKGILDVDDAKIAVTTGADAISVSNHGGRQLDGAPSAISALPPIADTVGSQVEVLMDSGVRTGADMVRALALGAKACIVGRSYIYGLGAGGQAGVARAVEILGKEFDTTMALCGKRGTSPRSAARRAGRYGNPAESVMKIPGPDHPITITPSKERVRVTFNGKVVADTKRALVLQEAAYKPVFYIPREDAQMALVAKTTHDALPVQGRRLVLHDQGRRPRSRERDLELRDAVSGDEGDRRASGVLSEPGGCDRGDAGLTAVVPAKAGTQ